MQKKQRPKIILTGCMVHHGNEKLYKMLPMVDEILPINEVGFNQAAIRKDKKHAWVPISVGCNSFCTYCIVPFVRGNNIRSKPIDVVTSEVQALANSGYKEIVLTGTEIGKYGKDINVSLSMLLKNLKSIKGLDRVQGQRHD